MYIAALNLQNQKRFYNRVDGSKIQHKVVQQSIEAIQNKNLEVFLKNSIDNIEIFKKNICSLGLYKEMVCAFKTTVSLFWPKKNLLGRLGRKEVKYEDYKIYRKNFVFHDNSTKNT
jgi:hypothetical protein